MIGAFQAGVMGSGRLWTPDLLLPEIWFDASDNTTLTIVDGKVSAINDKSGNGHHATQTDSAKRPTYITDSDGKYGIYNDGSVKYLSISPTYTINSSYSSFAVMARGSQIALFFGVSSPNYGQLISLWNDLKSYENPGTYTDGFAVANYSGAGKKILGWSRTNTSTYTARYNGADVSVTISGTPSALGVVSEIGRRPDEVYLDGFLHEGFVFPFAISSDNRLKLEGYLAHKWGLAANLPSDHPYKSAAPTV